MPLDAESSARENLGSLRVCLMEGDAEQRARERKVRRRALALSVTLQTILLAALLIVPLLAKTPPVSLPNFVPIPPYIHSAGPEHAASSARRTNRTPECHFCQPVRIPHGVHPLPPDNAPPNDSSETIDIGPGPAGPLVSGVIGILDPRSQPQVPPPPQQHRIVQGGNVQAAMLVYRVEPAYPILMKQIHRSGHVELHAVIATDGTVQSLQAISGDPGFYQSALDAVRQWRYRPTILNGQAVEVETSITVIYNIN